VVLNCYSIQFSINLNCARYDRKSLEMSFCFDKVMIYLTHNSQLTTHNSQLSIVPYHSENLQTLHRQHIVQMRWSFLHTYSNSDVKIVG